MVPAGCARLSGIVLSVSCGWNRYMTDRGGKGVFHLWREDFKMERLRD